MKENNPVILTAGEWQDYTLIDSGGFEKLERFGAMTTRRPEPQALWNKSMPEREWERIADAVFRRDGKSEERGSWQVRNPSSRPWIINYGRGQMKLRMKLSMTAFKHVGVFPEQAENWNYIYDQVLRIQSRTGEAPPVLNLFAYTGGATLAACSAGARTTHVDSVKQVVGWARENMELSGLDGIRWVVEDALKYARREVRRGSKYRGIILDPPAYGRGPDGEKWVLEENLTELLSLCRELLEPTDSFFVLNLYSMGLSALLACTAVRQLLGTDGAGTGEEFGELYFDDRSGKSLPLGVFYRLSR